MLAARHWHRRSARFSPGELGRYWLRMPAATGTAGWRTFTCGTAAREIAEKSAVDAAEGYRVLFFGTDRFSLPSLRILNEERVRSASGLIRKLEVVTLPDRRTGRGMNLHPVPVKQYAQQYGLPVHYPPPKTLRNWTVPMATDGGNFDLAVVVSFGYFLPPSVLDSFRWGGLNVHPSLLPVYRGSAPIMHAIMDGAAETGVTVQELDPHAFDAGRILNAKRLPLSPTARYLELEHELAAVGAQLLLETIAQLSERKQHAISQDVAAVTKAPKVPKEMVVVRWDEQDAITLERIHRALGWKMPLLTHFRGKPMLLRGEVCASSLPDDLAGGDDDATTLPGTVRYRNKPDALYIRCRNGWLQCTQVQAAGKRTLSASDWVNGYQVRSLGAVFESP
ncbi:formyl transferase [Thamnocephalis sphaerospora]|uniref:Methionyl-tRNA formyltransferase, mitochondrial n=1 Tax=Thamnocephalis sphaerospora TaxID=78915 RepID=A0A4P9XL96_9FUNG|nr:formyl transferase [Thamnocephalis sphaerospora]|eukprot:RKP06575.1 formyl transferase [Thamnocephalis sphaerospora]